MFAVLPSEPSPLLIAALVAVAGMLLGALLLVLLRRQDHVTWVLARAPELPIHALAAGDDAWLRGAVRSAQPLACPWFRVPCVAYSCRRERQHTWVTTDKDGHTTTHTEWRVEASERQACDFVLDDGEAIAVRMQAAQDEALVGLKTDYESSDLRHCASVLEVGAAVSVLGVKQDDGSFDGAAEVPCLVTRKTAAQRVRSSARSEAWLFFFAWFLPFAGGAVAAGLWLGPELQREPVMWLWLLPAGLLTMLPVWWLGVFNRLVRLRQQVLAAFRQVDVDLAVRAGLVPNLIAVVQGTAAHERELLAALAGIRSGNDPGAATAAEGSAAGAARQVLALHESYPTLKSDGLYLDLHDRLWAVEEKLAHTRTLYNDIVKEWNDRIAAFPSLLVAHTCGYRSAPPFAGDDAPLPPRLRQRDGPIAAG